MKIRFDRFLKMMLLGHMLDHVLDQMILGTVTTALQLPSSFA